MVTVFLLVTVVRCLLCLRNRAFQGIIHLFTRLRKVNGHLVPTVPVFGVVLRSVI